MLQNSSRGVGGRVFFFVFLEAVAKMKYFLHDRKKKKKKKNNSRGHLILFFFFSSLFLKKEETSFKCAPPATNLNKSLRDTTKETRLFPSIICIGTFD